MEHRPIKSIEISEFRGLTGTRVIPLDAPVVLIHGPNGAGKTSILSALEFGLTGRVHSMERADKNYLAHLPNVEKPFASVRVIVDDELQSGEGPAERVVVGGPNVTGRHALDDDAATFYRDRCYLDQASLGRLLDIYQHTEDKEESALARFVNELLGLDDIDALLEGLAPANNLANLKKLADRLKDADVAKKDAEEVLKRFTSARSDEQRNLQDARAAVITALNAAGIETDDVDGTALLTRIGTLNEPRDDADHRDRINNTYRDLLGLGGRITALAAQPVSQKLDTAKTEAANAAYAYDNWHNTHASAIDNWHARARALAVRTAPDVAAALQASIDTTQKAISNQDVLRRTIREAETQLATDQQNLAAAEQRFADAQQHASTLLEALATIQPFIDGDTCPVCDRDFTAVGLGALSDHVDLKVQRLGEHGKQLLQLRAHRDDAARRASTAEANLERLRLNLLDEEAMTDFHGRLSNLVTLQNDYDPLASVIAEGDALRQQAADKANVAATVEAAATEATFIENELRRFADELRVPSRRVDEPSRETWQRLLDTATNALEALDRTDAARRDATKSAARLRGAMEREQAAASRVLEAAQASSEYAAAIVEGQRRQAVARKVHEAATKARAAIVKDVFTDSLNKVWGDVFTRLAPNERFVPAFAEPESNKYGMTVNLETRDREGNKAAGTPQMMLSAGNLNTAALSLFLALHLAVEPSIKCLVFDDPVQAMDEVHIAQFAALIRGLAKQEQRQVIVAVHERELFDYLTLELSPAYDGDKLITVELGERVHDEDGGIRTIDWIEDTAVAG